MSPDPLYHLGVDTGGTFTDFVLVAPATGKSIVFKEPSRPDEPSAAVRAGLERLAREHAIEPATISRFVFGTTVATNAVLERRGATTALVTTRGMRDVLEIQRQWRHRLFDLALKRPPVLVPRQHRLECDERIGASGESVTALTDEEAHRVAAAVTALGVDAVAVSFIFSFLDPSHERRMADAIRAASPGIDVTLSSDVCPRFREYERSCTAVMNAYVMPKVRRLADQLDELLRDTGCNAPVRIMQSNGGLMSGARARTHPVHTLLSGPAGGVVGAMRAGGGSGRRDLIAMDMGGTSLDVSVVRGGEAHLEPEGRMAGFPVEIPQVDIHTIGAGGGSIARVERGALKIGPRSAGAHPGPACYGRGGVEPTSTDCAVTLGYIDPERFVGGEIRLDARAARAAVAANLAEPLRMPVEDAALAALEVQIAQMVAGVRAVTVERGLDPRDFSLLAFGGAGGLYASRVAAELGIAEVLVPLRAGVLSAAGLLAAGARCVHGTTRPIRTADVEAGQLSEVFEGLQERVRVDMALDGVADGAYELSRRCEMRYVGQAYEVTVPVTPGMLGAPDGEAIARGFHDAHRQRYGGADPNEPVEIVGFTVLGTGPGAGMPGVAAAAEVTGDGTGKVSSDGTGDETGQSHRARPVHLRRGEGPVQAAVYDADSMRTGLALTGPAIVETAGATVVIQHRDRATLDAAGNLVITLADSTSADG